MAGKREVVPESEVKWSRYKERGYESGLKERFASRNSPLVGMTLKKIEAEYHVAFDHVHHGNSEEDLRECPPQQDYKLEPLRNFLVVGRVKDLIVFDAALDARESKDSEK